MGDKLRGEICVLLQDLVLVEDFIELLQNEPTKLINSVLLHFKELTDNVQMSLLKVVRLSLKKKFLIQCFNPVWVKPYHHYCQFG